MGTPASQTSPPVIYSAASLRPVLPCWSGSSGHGGAGLPSAPRSVGEGKGGGSVRGRAVDGAPSALTRPTGPRLTASPQGRQDPARPTTALSTRPHTATALTHGQASGTGHGSEPSSLINTHLIVAFSMFRRSQTLPESTSELYLCPISVHIFTTIVLNFSQFIFGVGPLVSPQAERWETSRAARFPACAAPEQGLLLTVPLQGEGQFPSPAVRQNKTPCTSHKKANFASLYYLPAKTGKEWHRWLLCRSTLLSRLYQVFQVSLFSSALGEELQHSTGFGNHPHGTHRDVEQEHWVQKYREALLPDVEQC